MSLYLEHITQRFGQTLALNDIDLEIRNGEFLAILGPSGCGKTTLLRAIGGFAKPTEGKIRMDDVIYSGNGKMVPVEQRDLGMVFQSFALWPNMTVRQHVEFPMKSPKQKHLTEAQKKEAVDAAIENMGLKPYEDRYPGELSGGQRQRVSLARAIVGKPSILLMDEPLSNLDAKLRVQMRVEIAKIHKRLGATIIYVTHDQTEAMTLGTRIVVMNAGIVQQVDTPQTLYDYPCNQFVAGFIGSPQMNFVDAKCKVVGNKVYLVAGPSEIALPPAKAKKLIEGGYAGKTVVLGIRPEDVHDEQMFIETSPNTVIEAKIRVYEMLGAEVFLYFDYEGSSMTARVDPRTTARTGDTVKFALDAEKIHIFDKETQVTITN